MNQVQQAQLLKLLLDASPGPWEAMHLNDDGRFPSVFVGPKRAYSDNSGSHRPALIVNQAHDPGSKTAGADMPTFRATAELIAFLRNHAELSLATAKALHWALDEIDFLSNKLCEYAYPQGMNRLKRDFQFDNYRAAIRARAGANHGIS